jgi:hypothetical protein
MRMRTVPIELQTPAGKDVREAGKILWSMNDEVSRRVPRNSLVFKILATWAAGASGCSVMMFWWVAQQI